MKNIMISVVLAMTLVTVGCGKTLTELKLNGDAVVDNTSSAAGHTLVVAGGIVKKIIGIGKAVYEIGVKVVEDSKDNAVTVKDTVSEAANALVK